ncbi:hypothetical protein GGR52DRAFT_587902 [Hypoxylon sp. FL1284]|nr:hypothetical protein GGR52DRAFT_587902 [Hypoxylon sp. FL1284]
MDRNARQPCQVASPPSSPSSGADGTTNVLRPFKASCTHPTMTRLYDPYLTCSVAFDLLGASFAEHLKDRFRGPASRSDPFSIFKEITPEQMQSYTPSQLYTILSQRVHVLKVAQEASQPVRARKVLPPPGLEPKAKLWVPSASQQCRFTCCGACRPSAEWRSFLSLDAVVKGEIPPAAATGFGFHYMGCRPTIDPNALVNAGLRAVPLRKADPSPPTTPALSWASSTAGSSSDEQNIKTEHVECAESSGSSMTTQSERLENAAPDLPPAINGLFQNLQYCLTAARLTPLPPPTPDEQATLQSHSSEMMGEEMEEGRFREGPLEVDHGVAVLEESVGLGVPDFITQA